MGEARIGRVFVASLHQGIADIAPTRLEFYENWLNSAGLRHGTIGLAAMSGVLGFLRREDAYHLISERAGTYAANWTVASLSAPQRALIRLLPEPMRARYGVRLAREMIRRTYAGTRTRVKWRGGRARLDVRGSLFCTVREPVPQPLCVFYAAGIRRLYELLRLPAAIGVAECRGLGHRSCSITIALSPPLQKTASTTQENGSADELVGATPSTSTQIGPGGHGNAHR